MTLPNYRKVISENIPEELKKLKIYIKHGTRSSKLEKIAESIQAQLSNFSLRN